MRTLQECLYYLVREDFNVTKTPEYREKDEYFNDAIEYIRQHGLQPQNHKIIRIELIALINAARRRGRLEELGKVIKRSEYSGGKENC